MEDVAPSLCLCADRPEKLKGMEVESKEDLNPKENGSRCYSPMLIVSPCVCQALSYLNSTEVCKAGYITLIYK